MGMDKKIEKKKGIRPKHIVYGLGILALAAIITLSLKSANTSVYRADADKLTISEIISDEFRDYISITGMVEPISTIYLDIEEAGIVEEIVTEEGEMVKKGDVIIRLKNNDLKRNVLESESSIAYRANELRNTVIRMDQQKIDNKKQLVDWDFKIRTLKRAYEQNLVLFEKNLIAKENFVRSKDDYENALKNYDLALERMVQDSIFNSNQRKQIEEHLANMQRNMELTRQQLDNLNIKSPVEGQLGLLNAEIGESIGKGQNIGQINILSDYKVVAQVDEYHIDRVTKNLNAIFERQDEEFGLEVKKVYPEVREGTFEIDMVFSGTKPENIRSGQTYHIRLELGAPKQAVLIPRGGFFQSTGGQWVYVLEPGGTYAEKRSIRIGRQNPMFYEVIEGLEPGEKVITSSYEVFGENDRVSFR